MRKQRWRNKREKFNICHLGQFKTSFVC
jgi:hypothetical protein